MEVLLSRLLNTEERVLPAQEDLAVGYRRSGNKKLAVERIGGQDLERFSHLQDNHISVFS